MVVRGAPKRLEVDGPLLRVLVSARVTVRHPSRKGPRQDRADASAGGEAAVGVLAPGMAGRLTLDHIS